MKVIGAGFGRTGSMSLKGALEDLGFGPCLHMIDCIRTPIETRVDLWQEAADGKPVDWHEVFAGWESTVDWPGCSFYEQLMDAFPAAPVLLTVRDPDAWYESAQRSIYAATLAGRKGELQGGTDGPPPPEAMRMMGTLIWGDGGDFQGRFEDRDWAIEVFNRHNEKVRRTVPPERLLVHEISDGWEPLCEFLDVPVPDTPFPRLNDTDAFREMVGLPALS
ncbi:MAG TPA: sulfotransferase [Solirubrobacteraceae bacterium]|jgi:hypothetical protein|nr:sulfotransferase [Solirubrobacteraceae bacterium]